MRHKFYNGHDGYYHRFISENASGYVTVASVSCYDERVIVIYDSIASSRLNDMTPITQEEYDKNIARAQRLFMELV